MIELRLKTFDFLQQLKPRQYVAGPVRIVDIDDESLRRLGQWPWPRNTLAELVQRLSAGRAAVLALDFIFSEADRSSPSRVVSRLPNVPESAEWIRALPDNDDIFAQAIKKGDVVTSFALTSTAGGERPSMKSGWALAGHDPAPFVPEFIGSVANLRPIEAAAKGNGSVNLIPDRDLIVRRVPLLVRQGGQLYPSLVAEVERVASRATSFLVKSSGSSGVFSFGEKSGIAEIRVGAHTVRTDKTGQVVLYDTGPVAERTIPAWRLYEGLVDQNELRDAIVFIGTSAAALADLRATPLRAAVPGVEIHAQILEQILTGTWVTRPDWSEGAELVVLLFMGGALVLLLPRVGAASGAVVIALAVAVLFAATWWAFSRHGLLLAPAYPAFVLVFTYMAASLLSHLRTERAKVRVQNAFGRYLAPTLVEQLAADTSKLRLGGEVREMTFLFCDIRGFTAIAEQFRHEPEALINLINRFMTPMTEVVHACGGTIDKYIGDCIMAFWNAPLRDPDHARHACEAALGMTAALAKLNGQLRSEAADAPSPRERGPDRKSKAQNRAPNSMTEAVALLQCQAEAGYAAAQYKLGKAYRDGAGVAKDAAAAARWFAAAAEQGHAKAQEHIGSRYLSGEGVRQDRIEALAWLTLAAEASLSSAADMRGSLIAKLTRDEIAVADTRATAFRARIERRHIFELEVGIGINTGSCIVGNMGSSFRFDYSVVGDAVNLAARFEGQSRNYGVPIIVGQDTVRQVDGFAFLELDLLIVKGKQEPTRIYALLGGPNLLADPAFRALTEVHERMLWAYRHHDWAAARSNVAECRKLHPGGLADLYELYLFRIEQFEREAPSEGWHGVHIAQTK